MKKFLILIGFLATHASATTLPTKLTGRYKVPPSCEIYMNTGMDFAVVSFAMQKDQTPVLRIQFYGGYQSFAHEVPIGAGSRQITGIGAENSTDEYFLTWKTIEVSATRLVTRSRSASKAPNSYAYDKEETLFLFENVLSYRAVAKYSNQSRSRSINCFLVKE